MSYKKITIYTNKCPKCGNVVDRSNPKDYGLKYGRCSKCNSIYKTGRILYTDIPLEQRKKEYKENIGFLKFCVPMFIATLLITIILGWELVGLVTFFLGIGMLTSSIAMISRNRESLDKKYKKLKDKDPELYKLERERSEQIRDNI